jgi:hypothetical protein
MKSVTRTLFVALSLALTLPVTVNAAPVSFTVSGYIDQVAIDSWQTSNSIYEGEPVTITLNYDPTLFTYSGQYNSFTSEWVGSTAASLTIDIGAEVFTASAPELLLSSTYFNIYFAQNAFTTVSNASLGPCTSDSATCVALFLSYASPELNSAEVPSELPSNYDSVGSEFVYEGPTDNEGFGGFLDPSVAPTPLPATLPLFAGGLAFVGFVVRRKKRRIAVA